MSTHTPASTSSGTLRWPVLLAFAAIYVIWGSTYLAIRIGIETVPPFLLAGIRFVIAGAALYAGLRLSGTPRPTRAQWQAATIVGALMMFGGNGLVTWAEKTVPSSLAALLVTTVPLWMVALDALFFRGPRPNRWVTTGLVLGLAGVAVLVGPAEGAVAPLGAGVLLLATFFWAMGSLRARSATLPSSPFLSAAMQMLAGGLVILVVATGAGEWQQLDLAAVSSRSFLALVYLIFFGSIVALSAYVYLLRETTAVAVSTYAFVNPVIALLLGLWVGEPITGRSLVGACLIIGAVVLIHWARQRRAAPRPLTASRIATVTAE